MLASVSLSVLRIRERRIERDIFKSVEKFQNYCLNKFQQSMMTREKRTSNAPKTNKGPKISISNESFT